MYTLLADHNYFPRMWLRILAFFPPLSVITTALPRVAEGYDKIMGFALETQLRDLMCQFSDVKGGGGGGRGSIYLCIPWRVLAGMGSDLLKVGQGPVPGWMLGRLWYAREPMRVVLRVVLRRCCCYCAADASAAVPRQPGWYVWYLSSLRGATACIFPSLGKSYNRFLYNFVTALFPATKQCYNRSI